MFEIQNITQPPTIDSREVARMLNKKHPDLLRDIKRNEDYFTESTIAFSEFFLETTYKDASGKQNKNYQITRKGCEFLAHKMTGKKGAIFTAKFVNAFHAMEQELTSPALSQNILLELMESQKRFMEQATELIKQSAEFKALPAPRKRKSKTAKPLLIETFPPEIQEVVDVLVMNGYSAGKIRTLMKAMGYSVSENAIRRYIKQGGGN